MIDVQLMPAGRALDELIAMAVFGWKREPNHPEWPTEGTMLVPPPSSPMRNWCAEWDDYGRPDWLPNYSGDLELAFGALRALPKDDKGMDRWYWKLTCLPSYFDFHLWRADGRDWSKPEGGPSVDAHGITMPLAICRALVKALRT